jgi:hypothetical protein
MSAHFLFASEVADDADGSIDKLLAHQIGMSRLRKHPVTVRSVLEVCGRDPDQTARRLMSLPPETAVRELTDILANFRIDGVRCPEPEKFARSALKRAGVLPLPALFVSDYGHCATALLGIAALGILLAFPTLML